MFPTDFEMPVRVTGAIYAGNKRMTLGQVVVGASRSALQIHRAAKAPAGDD
jgi:hypothetical protein